MRLPRRFTLRAFLVITIAIGVATGIYSNRVAQQRSAVAAITELGGSVRYSCDYYTVDQIPAWLISLVGADFFCNIEHVHVADTSIYVAGSPLVVKDGEATVITCSSARPLSRQTMDASSMFADMKPTESRGRRWGSTISTGIHLQYEVRCTRSTDGLSRFEFRVLQTESPHSGLVAELW